MNQHRIPHCEHINCSRPRIKGLHKIHHFLCEKSSHYHTWHHHKHHRKVHYATLAVYILTILATVIYSLTDGGRALAATNAWNFSVPGDYTVGDSGKIEVASNSAHLKVNEYTNDANTSALYHLNETEGATATDSSSNNNSATVSNSPTWEAGKLNNGVKLNGTSQYLSASDSASLSLSQSNTIEAWTKFNSDFSSTSHAQQQPIVDKGDYKLYYDNETGKITYELANTGSTNWTKEGGDEVKGSWDNGLHKTVASSTYFGNNYYAGLGYDLSDAEVWKWNGTVWSKIGGDGVNNSWADGQYEIVQSMTNDGSNLYVGLGSSANDAEVWLWNGSAWSQIGGDSLNSGWTTNYEIVNSLIYSGSTLYAGLGNSTNDAEVWAYASASWTKIGGDGVSSSWNTNYEEVDALAIRGSTLYAGIGTGTGDAELWRYASGAWAKIGGDGVNTSWNTNYEKVMSLVDDGTNLYAGLGTGNADAEVWTSTGGDLDNWSQIGGDGTGWAAATYEGVYSLLMVGTTLYASLGYDFRDAEVYAYAGGNWSKVGGDGTNGGFNQGTQGTDYVACTLAYNGVDTLYAGIQNTSNTEASVWSLKDNAWTKIGGNYINKSWGRWGYDNVQAMTTVNGILYMGTGNATYSSTPSGDADVWQYDGSTWTQIGGQGINSSWAFDAYEVVTTMSGYKGNLYVGLGYSTGDAEVWKWDGNTWLKIGGDGEGSSWNTNYEDVDVLGVYGDNLIAGLGNGGGDAEVWQYNGSSWLKIGGDSEKSSWASPTYEYVWSMTSIGNNLYVGLGAGAGDAEVWQYNGSTWSMIGGDGLFSSWANSTFNLVQSLVSFENTLYVGLSSATDYADVWKWDGQNWSQVGGDGINSSWGGGYESVVAMTVYNGSLYASLGTSAGDGEVWKFNGVSWSKVGGDGINSSWGSAIEGVYAMTVYKGKLFVGLGNTQNVDPQVWSFGNNGFLQSVANTQDTNWHHIAATYDGVTMKLYIDGILNSSTSTTLTIPDSNSTLLIGTDNGSYKRNGGKGFFAGSLDEVRISNTARSSFNTTLYSSEAQSVRPTSTVLTSQVKSWDNFTSSETTNGGAITYRLSSDGGTTWKYWDGGAWATSSSTANANSQADIASHIATFPITENGLIWQAVLDGDGTQLVTLNSVTLTYTADVTAPTNPNLDHAYNEQGGAIELTNNSWYAYGQPYFEWSGATDTGGSGVSGYYVYFGTNAAGNPIDYQTAANYKASSLASGSTYYLRIKTRDNAFNPSAAITLFTYKYNAGGNAPTAPQNISHQKCVSEIEAPNCSGGQSTAESPSSVNRFSFTWDEPTFYLNTISAYYYSINVEPTETNVTTTNNKYLQADSFATLQGKNTLYVVAKDSTGNISYSNYASVDFYASTSAPGIPQNLSAIDSSNRSVSQYRVTITWTAPTTGIVSNYKVFRSTDNAIYAQIGSTSSTAYIESGLTTGTTYYYKVKSSDNAGSDSAYSSMASKNPTGKYTEPPAITTTPVASTGANYMRVIWDTDRVAEAVVEVGTTTSYGINGLSLDPMTHHDITISGLTPGTNYHYRVQSLDPGELRDYASTAGKSADYTFSTQPAPGMSDVNFSDITTNSAILTFQTTKASVSTIEYGPSLSYGNRITDESSGSTTQHTIRFANLNDGTTYQVKITIQDTDGNNVSSIGHAFTTVAKPSISNVQLQPIKDAAVTTYDVVWSSNVPISSSVAFSASGKIPKSNAKGDLEKEHSLRVEGLEDQATYSILVSGRDQFGNLAEYTAPSVTTPIDSRPPKLSNLTVEVRASGVGTAQKAQIIVSWETDEPATSMVEYDQGITGDTYGFKSQQDQAYTTTHVVILSELEPSKLYHLRAVSSDKAGNTGNSPDTSAITGKTQKSVIDIILNSLVNSFGWLGNIFK